MVVIHLFLTFFKISLFAIGGAYSFLPLLERDIVDKYHWLTKHEFLDVLAMVKLFPGAISIKFATYTGYKVAGITGALVANIANALVPIFIVIFLFNIYAKYKDSEGLKSAFSMVQLAVFAMVIAVAFRLISPNQLFQLKNIVVISICFILFLYTKVNPAFIIMATAIIGFFIKK